MEDLVTDVFGPEGFEKAFINNSPYGLCAFPEFGRLFKQWKQKTSGDIRALLELSRDGWVTEDRKIDGTIPRNELGNLVKEGRLHMFQIPSLLWTLGLNLHNQKKYMEASKLLDGLGIYIREETDQALVVCDRELINTVAT